MDLADDVGLRDIEDVDVVLQRAWVVGEALAAVVGFLETLRLEEGAPRSIENEDAIAERGAQRLEALGSVHRVLPSGGRWTIKDIGLPGAPL